MKQSIESIRDSYVRKDDIRKFKDEVLSMLEGYYDAVNSIESKMKREISDVKSTLCDTVDALLEKVNSISEDIDSKVVESYSEIENLTSKMDKMEDSSVSEIMKKINFPVQKSVGIPVPIDQGGTGATTQAQAITNLGAASVTNTDFTNSDLSAGLLTFTADALLGIFDNNNDQIIPDNVDKNGTTFTVDLTSFGTLSGTWVRSTL